MIERNGVSQFQEVQKVDPFSVDIIHENKNIEATTSYVGMNHLKLIFV